MKKNGKKSDLKDTIDNSLIDIWSALDAMQNYSEIGIQKYIAEKLKYEPSLIQYLPQMVNILINSTKNEISFPMYHLLKDWAKRSKAFSVALYFYLKSIMELNENGKSIWYYFLICDLFDMSKVRSYRNLKILEVQKKHKIKMRRTRIINHARRGYPVFTGICLFFIKAVSWPFGQKFFNKLREYEKIFLTSKNPRNINIKADFRSGHAFTGINLKSNIYFIASLVDISNRLKRLPRHLRQKGLEMEVALLNFNLPANVSLPFWPNKYILFARIEESSILDSAENTPFVIVFEVADKIVTNGRNVTEELRNASFLIQQLNTISDLASLGEIDTIRENVIDSIEQVLLAERLDSDISNEKIYDKQINESFSKLNISNEIINDRSDSNDHLENSNGKSELNEPNNDNNQAETLNDEFFNKSNREIRQLETLNNESFNKSDDEIIQLETSNNESFNKSDDEIIQLETSNNEPFNKSDDEISQSETLNDESNSGIDKLVQLTEQKRVSFEIERIKINKYGTMDDTNIAKSTIKESKSYDMFKISERSYSANVLYNPKENSGLSETDSEKNFDFSNEDEKLEISNNCKGSNIKHYKKWIFREAELKKTSKYKHLPGWGVKSVIVKSGSSVKQEIIAYQILSEMKNIWLKEKLPIWLYPYKIYLIDNYSGLVETVNNALSIHKIKESKFDVEKRYFLKTHFNDSFGLNTQKYQNSIRNFLYSLVGYSIATYILQIKDRHNGNILIDDEGHVIHVDFGFVLGKHPGFYCVEMAPFKFCKEYLDLLGENIDDFKKLFLEGFKVIRKYADRLCKIIEMSDHNLSMESFGQKEAFAFRQRFRLDMDDKEIEEYVMYLINSSFNSMGTGLYDSYQYFSHGYL